MNTFKGKVKLNAERSIARRKELLNEYFKNEYDKPKIFEFPPLDKINMNRHFYIPKGFTSLKGLSKSAFAIYPVLCSLADFEENKWFHESRENIAKMAGINPSTVDKGIENLTQYFLEEERLLERQMKTEGKRHLYFYRVGFVRKQMMEEYKGQYYIFYSCIIDSGIWAQLTPRAKALYLAIRSLAKFDSEAYGMDYDIENYQMPEIYGEAYKDRICDYCIASLGEICRMVNIDSSKTRDVIAQLEDYKLIERQEHYIKVYLRPDH